MKRLLIFSAAGLMAASLPALALAQTTPPPQSQQTMPQTQPQQTVPQAPPQTVPKTRSQQTMPQQMQPRNDAMQKNMPMRQQTSSPTQKEISMAHTHALMAQGAKTLQKSHTHLHHVINCLVGPQGNGFDATTANPCAGMGQGALSDSKNKRALHMRVKKALKVARKGVKTSDLKKSQKDAAKVASLLQTGSVNTGASQGEY